MQLDAASRSADLKVVHIEEANARDAHKDSPDIIQLPDARLLHKIVEHLPCGGELPPIWRYGVAAEVGVVRFHDHTLAGIVRILENDVNIVIALASHARDSAHDLIYPKFLIANAVIGSGTALRTDGVQNRHRRLDHRAKLNAAGVAIAKALYMGTAEGAARSEDGECH
jgi:hypothetical protein